MKFSFPKTHGKDITKRFYLVHTFFFCIAFLLFFSLLSMSNNFIQLEHQADQRNSDSMPLEFDPSSCLKVDDFQIPITMYVLMALGLLFYFFVIENYLDSYFNLYRSQTR